MTQQNQSPVVTDEMVERAAKELSQHLYTRFGQPDNEAYEEMSTADRLCYQRSARAALEAALPSGVRVKPLEWEEGPVGHHTDYAQSICGEWAAWEIKGHAYYRSPGMKSGKLGGITLVEAKAAAQADYERRILSALEGEGHE